VAHEYCFRSYTTPRVQELHDSRRTPQVTAFEITDQLGRLCLRVPFTLAQRSPANAGVGEVR
jgi:hypothetical protein